MLENFVLLTPCLARYPEHVEFKSTLLKTVSSMSCMIHIPKLAMKNLFCLYKVWPMLKFTSNVKFISMYIIEFSFAARWRIVVK